MIDIKKRYKLVLIGLVIMTILNVVIIASLWINRPPWVSGDRGSMRADAGPQMLIERLGLDEQQLTTFRELRDAYRVEIRASVQQIQRDRRKLYNAIGTTDSEKIDSLASAVADGYKQIEIMNVRHFSELRKHLNDQQQEKFDLVLDRMGNQMLRRPGHRRMFRN